MAKVVTIYCAHTELVNIEKVIPNPRNPNKHPDKQIAMLAKIIDAQGWRAPITVSRRSGFIVRGHGRLMAARKLGLDMVPVDYQDYESEAAEWADLIADNRLSELSDPDVTMLKDLLQDIDSESIGLTAYTAEEIEALLNGDKQAEEDDFDADAALNDITEPVTKLGDVYKLGNHRLMCGDSTDAETVGRLMDGQKADIAFTSPPYNAGSLNVAGNESTKRKYNSCDDQKSDEEYFEFICSSLSILMDSSVEVFLQYRPCRRQQKGNYKNSKPFYRNV